MTDGVNQLTGKPRIWDKYFDTASLNGAAKKSFENQFDAYENTKEGANDLPKIKATIDLVHSYGIKINKLNVVSTSTEHGTGLDIGYSNSKIRLNYQFNHDSQNDITLNKKGQFIEGKFGGNDGAHHEIQHLTDLKYLKTALDLAHALKKEDSIGKVVRLLNVNKPLENPNEYEKSLLESANKYPDLKSKNEFLALTYMPIAQEIKVLEKSKEGLRYKSEQKAVAAENIFLDEDHQRAGGAYILRMSKDDKRHMDSTPDNKLDLREIAESKAAINFGMKNEKGLDQGFFKDALKALDDIELYYKGQQNKGKNVAPGHNNNPGANKGNHKE